MAIIDTIFYAILLVIDVYTVIIIASAIMSWLVAFQVVNPRNQFVYQVGYALHRMTEPALRPIRQFLPNLGGIDISPIILLIGLQILAYFVGRLYVGIV